jgi:N-acylneuraminate cytidylyltransferase
MANQTLALIPARGGSKGVPRKNVMMIAGKPMIAYSILQQASRLINRVIVSTDDEEIAAVAREWGRKSRSCVPLSLPKIFPGYRGLSHALTWP